MATIFISHSHRDDSLANELAVWLRANGFTDFFIDHSDVPAGGAWADALRANAGSCRVVLCLVTPNWLASNECPSEFKAAWYMGKRIIPLFLLGDENNLAKKQRDELTRVRAEAQGLDLMPLLTSEGISFAADEVSADMLKRGLREAGALATVGLDPEAFETDRVLRASPFPGLTAFGDEDADAALFFGRSREIAETLELLRKMRAAADANPLVILGASGSGKSSLLKAGIIPRLRREGPAWLPLRVFRPGADPLLNFAEAITRTLTEYNLPEAHGVLRRTLMQCWQCADRDDNGGLTTQGRLALTDLLEEQANRLRAGANRPGATILISVDQAEELARSNDDSGQALADFLRAAMDAGSHFRLAFTIRTDSFPELQFHPRFQGLEARGYDLRTLPVFRFDDVVEDPAARYGVKVEPALTDALMEDAPGKDALPMLAFALQRLWDQFAASGKLTYFDYSSMGGLSGLIEDAAERALCGIEPEQRDAALPRGGAKPHQVQLCESVFVPALADINDEGAAIRRMAMWVDFSPRQHELLERFDRWRLVVNKDGPADTNGATVEVSHETLFREWTRLRDWLEPERARLEALRGLKLAAMSWKRHERQRSFLVHFGDRLEAAAALAIHPRYGSQLGEDEKAYLAAAEKAQRSGLMQRRSLQASSGVALIALLAGGAAFINQEALERTLERQVLITAASSERLDSFDRGDVFRDCRFDAPCPDWMPEMVLLPAGQFKMGVTYGDQPSFNNTPTQNISISRFAVGKFEITHHEWQACVDRTDQDALEVQRREDADSEAPTWVGCAAADQSTFGGGELPVINVGWHDTQGYVRWLNKMVSGDPKGGPYRLLSEAEWEYAARGAAKIDTIATTFAWGNDDPICERGAENGAVFDQCNERRTQTVGFSAPNAFGLHDMNGNVFEWVEDCFRNSLHGQPATGEAYNERNCQKRIVRGGAWSIGADYQRTDRRVSLMPANRVSDVGFRVARTVD